MQVMFSNLEVTELAFAADEVMFTHRDCGLTQGLVMDKIMKDRSFWNYLVNWTNTQLKLWHLENHNNFKYSSLLKKTTQKNMFLLQLQYCNLSNNLTF